MGGHRHHSRDGSPGGGAGRLSRLHSALRFWAGPALPAGMPGRCHLHLCCAGKHGGLVVVGRQLGWRSCGWHASCMPSCSVAAGSLGAAWDPLLASMSLPPHLAPNLAQLHVMITSVLLISRPVSIISLQWLCSATDPPTSIRRFFAALHASLRPGARAALQAYPEGARRGGEGRACRQQR